jgi:hypothetical protein
MEAGIQEQIVQQPFVGYADRDEGDIAILFVDVRREETMAVETLLAILVSPVRANPEGAISDAGSPLQVRLKGLAMHFQKAIEIKLLHRAPRLIGAIHPQDIILVIGDDEEVRVDGNSARGIAHAGVLRRADQAERGDG